MRVILSEAKPPRQVAPSPPRYACHLSRFNGRAYSRKGGFPRSILQEISNPTVLPFQAILRRFAQDDNLFTVMLSVSETPSAGRPLSGTLRVPPLPLQRESILPKERFFAEYITINTRPGR